MMKYFYFLIFTSFNLSASNISWPEWSWTRYMLQEFIGLDSDNMNQVYLERKVNLCLQNLSEPYCDDTITELMLLASFDRKSAANIAQNFINQIPDNINNNNYDIREYAIRALALNGDSTMLIAEVDDDPFPDDAYVMALSGNFIWSEVILQYLTEADIEPENFCYAVNRSQPFIYGKHSGKESFIDGIKSAVLSSDLTKSACSVLFLVDNYISSTIENFLKSQIPIFLESSDFQKIRIGRILVEKWPLTVDQYNQNIASYIQVAVGSDDVNIKEQMNEFLLSSGYLSVEFPEVDDQIDELQLTIRTSVSSLNPLGRYLAEKPIDGIWFEYINTISQSDLNNLLHYLLNSINVPVDLDSKLSILKNNTNVSSNWYLNFTLAKVAKKFGSVLEEELVTDLLGTAIGIQKNALIATFPTVLANEKVTILNTSNSWVNLAELVNLMVICNVEIPPIDDDIIEDGELENYLSKGFELLSSCSRLDM